MVTNIEELSVGLNIHVVGTTVGVTHTTTTAIERITGRGFRDQWWATNTIGCFD